MPKARSIDPSFWDDPEIATLTRDERLLIIGMITACADDEGRLIGDAGYLRKTIFGYDDDVTRADVQEWRDGIISKCRNVKLYEVGGQLYICFVHWQTYQPMRYAIRSKLPEYADDCEITHDISETSGNLPKITKNMLHARGRVELGRVGLGSVEDGAISANAEAPPTPPPPDKRKARNKTPTKAPTTIPDSFAITQEMIAWAVSKAQEYNVPLNVRLQAEKFINYYRNGNGKTKTHTDWPASWVQWVLREIDDLSSKGLTGNGTHKQDIGSGGTSQGTSKQFIEKRKLRDTLEETPPPPRRT